MRKLRGSILAWILAAAMFMEPAACAMVSAQETVPVQEEQTGENQPESEKAGEGKNKPESEEAGAQENGLESEEAGAQENEPESEKAGEGENKPESEEAGAEENQPESEEEEQPEDEENDMPGEQDGEASGENDLQTLSGNSVSENTVTAEDGELQTGYYEDPDALYQAGSFDVVIETPEDNYSAMDAEAQSLRDEAIRAIYEGLRDKKASIDVSAYGFTKSDLATFEAVYYGVVNDHPEFYYVKTAYRYWSHSSGEIVNVEPQYMDYDFDDEAFQQATQEAMSLIDDGMTEVEKALVLHDYIAVTCAYDKVNYDNSKGTQKRCLRMISALMVFW